MLNDAVATRNDSLAHAVSHRARNSVWLDVAEAYQDAHPGMADSAEVLAQVEGRPAILFSSARSK